RTPMVGSGANTRPRSFNGSRKGPPYRGPILNWAGGNSPHWSPWDCPGTFGISNKSPGLDLQVFVDGLYRQVPWSCQVGLDSMVSQFKNNAFLLMDEFPCNGLLIELLCGSRFLPGKIKELGILKENDHQ